MPSINTPEETFRKLKQRPFEEVYEKLLDLNRMPTSNQIIHRLELLSESTGWEISEFIKEADRRGIHFGIRYGQSK